MPRLYRIAAAATCCCLLAFLVPGVLADRNISKAFLVKVKGCSGTLIAQNWVLTAAHCLDTELSEATENANGDYELNFDYYFPTIQKPLELSLDDVDRLWTRPFRASNSFSGHRPRESVRAGWRRIEKVILNGKHIFGAETWRGNDLALVKLSPESHFDPSQGAYFAPACLPDRGFDDVIPESTYMAGYGRRNLPHCMTTHLGPEAYETCARPIRCSKHHTAFSCGLRFLYGGQYHNECLHSDTPSAADPECVRFRQMVPDMADSDKVVHIYDWHGDLATKCYPKRPPSGTKGWCTTRPPGTDDNVEPTATSGWGFCSNDKAFENCNGAVYDQGFDPTPHEVQVLNDDFCSRKLGKNLNVEQPSVRAAEYARPRTDLNLLCIGSNKTFSGDNVYYKKRSLSRYAQMTAHEAGVEPEYLTDGGPSCFGDSGGPLYKVLPNPDKPGEDVPVLTGVFSFVLWGTCKGRDEPGYYARVTSAVDWIEEYVDRNEMCYYGPRGLTQATV